MKLYTLEKAQEKPVSHDPGLKKKLLVPDGVGCVRHISHIVLKQGESVADHSHSGGAEVFYCIRGSLKFSVNGEPALLSEGSCIIVEPGEAHAIVEVSEKTELLYMMVAD